MSGCISFITTSSRARRKADAEDGETAHRRPGQAVCDGSGPIVHSRGSRPFIADSGTSLALVPNGNEEEFEYDVALSFAGEDRGYVQPIAETLRQSGVKVFYDEFEQSAMWGADLFVFLDEVFRKKSRYAVVFLSRHYVEKHWPTHEGKSAQARALIQQHSPFFLPVRLDDSEFPGLRPTVGYVDAREAGRERVIALILEKVAASRPIDRVPRTEEEEALLLKTRPEAWEYLLFAAVLRRGMDALEPKWRDHELRYTSWGGPAMDIDDAYAALMNSFDEVQAIIGNVERLLNPESSERAFGAIGESGHPDRIIHLAERVTGIYGELLDWSARLRAAVVPKPLDSVFKLASAMADRPLQEIRDWVDLAVAEIDCLPAALREGTQVDLVLSLVLTMDDELLAQFNDELRKLES
jgi:hypothetical protein